MPYSLLQLQQMGATPGTVSPAPHQGANYTQQQLQQMGATPGTSQPTQTGFLGTLKNIYDNAITRPATAAANAVAGSMKDTSDALANVWTAKTPQDAALGALDAAGAGVGAALNVVGAPVNMAINAASNIPTGGGKNLGDRANQAIQPVADAIASIPGMQELSQIPGIDKHVQSFINLVTPLVVSHLGGNAPTEKGVTNAIDSTKAKISDTVSTAANAVLDPLGSLGNTLIDKLPKFNPTEADVVVKRIDSLKQIENNNSRISKIVNQATGKGVDVKNIVAKTDLLQGSVDEAGNLNTLERGGAVDQFNQFMSGQESVVSDALKREGISIPFSQVEESLNNSMNSSRLAGGSKTRIANLIKQELDGLRMDVDSNGNIPLDKLQDAKISTTNGIDYTKPETKINAKMVGNTYKTLIENNSKLPVKNLNGELSTYYQIGDYLEALNGKKIQGGKLGKYFASTVGGIAGSHFGPFGTVIGAEIASKLKGLGMSSTFGPEIGKNLVPSELMTQTVNANSTPRLALPAPAEGSVKVQNNVPIELGGKSTIEPQSKIVRMNGQTNANNIPDNVTGQSINESTTATTQKVGERVIPKKIPQTEDKASLTSEAKKYKSADEFVKAQGETVYHGTSANIKRFNNKQGTFFTNDMMNADGYAGGENVYEGRLVLKKPLVIDAKGKMYNDLKTEYGKSTREIVGKVDNNKYDGVIFKNIKDSWIDDAEAQDPTTIYYAFKPRDSFLNDSQLTDIWKKANKK